MLVICLHAQLN